MNPSDIELYFDLGPVEIDTSQTVGFLAHFHLHSCCCERQKIRFDLVLPKPSILDPPNHPPKRSRRSLPRRRRSPLNLRIHSHHTHHCSIHHEPISRKVKQSTGDIHSIYPAFRQSPLLAGACSIWTFRICPSSLRSFVPYNRLPWLFSISHHNESIEKRHTLLSCEFLVKHLFKTLVDGDLCLGSFDLLESLLMDQKPWIRQNQNTGSL